MHYTEITQIKTVDQLLEEMNRENGSFSAKDVETLIGRLGKIEQQKKKQEEKKRELQREAEKKRLEEQKKRDAQIEEIKSMDLPLDWENLFDGDARTQGVHVERVSDALIMSLSQLGKVDIEYIASITDKSYKTVITALQGSIYQNPEKWEECFYKGWETAEEYLSGNLMRKLKVVRAANKEFKGYFQKNIEALEKHLPPCVATKDIYITLGSPWVPVDIIDDFITHILKLKNDVYIGTKHDEITGTWEIPHKSRYRFHVGSTNTYGTSRIEALHILERTLNMKTISVTDEVACTTNVSGKKRVVNKSETILALEKQEKMIEEFQKWVWKNERRKERLEIIFENNFSSVRKRLFDGSFLEFPTMSPDITLYPYQKNAIARILFSPNTLLAHEVGAGKTYIMIAAGMELKRMGLSNKNLYVVPNNIVGQWKRIFSSMYPQAKVLCIEPKHFTPQKKEATLEKIRDEDYDGIIIAASCFERIPISRAFYIEELEQKKKAINKIALDASKATSKLENKKKNINRELGKLYGAIEKLYDCIYFDELGITRLFVDEAHYYKNVPIETKINQVLGISTKGSKKCKDMMDKVHLIQKQNDGGGVVMATGTPITNSITDAYIMQKYLQEGELAMLELQNFDSWVGMFAERVTEFEIDVDTSGYRLATRFSKFHNLPELSVLLSSIADFHQMEQDANLPTFDDRKDAVIAKSNDFSEYMKQIAHRADAVRKGWVFRTDDNMLKITTDGRKAALDLRLVDGNASFTYQSKAARCAENVFEIYWRSEKQKSTQLIFCDSSTPKKGFNLYEEMKTLLVNMGIPSDQIAFVHDADTEKQRENLFSQVRKGEIRILIGSTFKLGIGVNIQKKLIALHHLDVPWRPADMIQREGRILRQGNENKNIQIFRYIAEGSFDAYSWQLLETKQRFITSLLSCSLQSRSGGDIENTVLDYAEVKALAVGNPLIKERVETANELSRLQSLQKKSIESHILLEQELNELPNRIKKQVENIEACQKDMSRYESKRVIYDKEQRREIREKLYSSVQNYELMNKETKCMSYQGFDIILPVNMTVEKPYIWLQGYGKYYINLGDTKIGALIRIDNFLDNLDSHLLKLNENLEKLKVKLKDTNAELTRKPNYADQIEACERKLENLDKALGVKQI